MARCGRRGEGPRRATGSLIGQRRSSASAEDPDKEVSRSSCCRRWGVKSRRRTSIGGEAERCPPLAGGAAGRPARCGRTRRPTSVGVCARVRCSGEVSQPATCLPSGMHPLGCRPRSSDGVRGALLRARGGKPCHISPWVVDKAANCAFGKVVRQGAAVLPQGCHFCGWDLKGTPCIVASEPRSPRILGS